MRAHVTTHVFDKSENFQSNFFTEVDFLLYINKRNGLVNKHRILLAYLWGGNKDCFGFGMELVQ